MSQVLIAMSGGVDSSVAAHLVLQDGHSCVGATMRLYESEGADAAIVFVNAPMPLKGYENGYIPKPLQYLPYKISDQRIWMH